MDGTLTSSSVAKLLASCKKSTRDRALKAWLSEQRNPSSSSVSVSDEDLLKIWKGLFYCVWHADKLPVQVDLINRLSSLLVSLDLSLSARYFAAFIATIRREWSGIDYYRLDKFYLLIRRFLHHIFDLLSRNSWNLDLSVRMIEVIAEKSLLAVDKYPAQGVNYHIAEIFLDEIREFLPIALETVDALLKPFLSVLEKSHDKVLVNKIKSNVFDRLHQNGVKLLSLERAGDHADSGSEVENFGKIALSLGLAKKFFGSASASETFQGNRKVLFGLHDCFLKLEKDLEKSGVHISLLQLENGDSVSTEQVEVDPACGNGGADDKKCKKKKKSKKASDNVKKSRTKKITEIDISATAIENGDSVKALELVVSESTEQVEVDPGCGNEGTEEDKPSKKRKKSKIASDGVKKSKTKKIAEIDISATNIENGNDDIVDRSDVGVTDMNDTITFDESVISNLQKQFEKVAAEAGMAIDGTKLCALPTTPVTDIVAKKRKRAKSVDGRVSVKPSNVNGGSATGKSGDKSVKKVRFSMKSNLVWKPHSPLPPQNLRLPPSATPRGSALKKGIPPGPIKETPASSKKIKVKGNSAMKVQKSSKRIPAAVKRLRKLQSLSV